MSGHFLSAGGGTRTRTPPRGTPDFKLPLSVSACLGRSELFLLTRPVRPFHRRRPLGSSRWVSLPLLCHPAAIGYRSPGSRRCPCGSPSRAAWFRTETPLPADTTATCTCGGGSSSIAGSTSSASLAARAGSLRPSVACPISWLCPRLSVCPQTRRGREARRPHARVAHGNREIYAVRKTPRRW